MARDCSFLSTQKFSMAYPSARREAGNDLSSSNSWAAQGSSDGGNFRGYWQRRMGGRYLEVHLAGGGGRAFQWLWGTWKLHQDGY